jgi:MtrB/PioB family decaheme-associated outer membrane protein
MRTRRCVVVAALLLVSAGAQAQQVTAGQDAATAAASGPPRDLTTNQADFGFRVTHYGDAADQARYQRYRDLRDGATLDLFRFAKRTAGWSFIGQADHVGYQDQRYAGSVNNFGRFKASFEWNQIPLFYSRDTQTLYTSSTPGVLRLDENVQAAIQGGTLNLAQVAPLATTFDLRSERDIAEMKAVFNASRTVDLTFYARNTTRTGQQQFSSGFGFSDAVDVPVPLDMRAADVGAALEYAHGGNLVKLGYDGSLFRNNLPTLVWDNPLRQTDSPTAGPYQGREANWANSDYHSVNVTGVVSMAGHSQASAYVAVGSLGHNDPLIPFTINTALVSPTLDRTMSEAAARTTATAFSFTSRPTPAVWLSARYRSYDFDNRTPVFHVGNSVNYDTAIVALNGEADPMSHQRQTFNAETSLTPVAFTAFRVGYTREMWDYTDRQYAASHTDTMLASLDTTGLTWLSLRGVYEHATRTGTGLDLTDLIAEGEQPTLRQYDIASKNTDRFSTILQVLPVSTFSISAMAGIGKENYPDTTVTNGFGLFRDDSHSYSVGADYVPVDQVSMGIMYERDTFTGLQWSRTANPLSATDQTFTDPRRNWSDHSTDRTDTVTASMDLLKAIAKTDIRIAYDYSKAASSYVYGLAPDTTLPTPLPLDPILNKLQRGSVDVKHYVTPHLAAGFVYAYEKYDVNDFANSPATITSIALPSYLTLGVLAKPYTAQTVSVRLSYFW